MDLSRKVPRDGEVYSLSRGDNSTRAEFVESLETDGLDYRMAWRLYDRLGRGVLLTEVEMVLLCQLTDNYLQERNAK